VRHKWVRLRTTLHTGPKASIGDADVSEQQVSLYSDLLRHRMGRGLKDGISQGQAEGDEFRTAPLWGLGSARCRDSKMKAPTRVGMSAN